MVRLFSWRDIFLLNKLQQEKQQLALTRKLLYTDAPLMSAMVAMLKGHLNQTHDPLTLIFDKREREHRLTGCLQMRGRFDAKTCEVVFLAPAIAKSNRTSQIWQKLLSAACQYAGEHKKQRVTLSIVSEIYSQLPINVAEAGNASELHKLGFDTYTHETLYYRSPEIYPVAEAISPSPDVRDCTDVDHASIDALYAHVAPRNVRQAESSLWTEFDGGSRILPTPGGWREKDYVVEKEGIISGVLRIVRGDEGYWLKILPRAEEADCASTLLDHGLGVLASLPPRPIYCSVRDYEVGVKSVLENNHFNSLARQTLLVKHLAVWVKEEKLAHALAEVKPQIQPANAVLREGKP